jgi:hypothetical protein
VYIKNNRKKSGWLPAGLKSLISAQPEEVINLTFLAK